MINNFRFWCQKVLPSVYDDSLSYYELLCKVVDYLNQVIDQSNKTEKEMEELKSYVDNYFNNLDVTDEINKKLDAMAADGTLANLINKVLFGELNDKIENVQNWSESNDDISNFRKDALSVAASYLMTVYNSSCVEGNVNGEKVCWEYNTNKGYLGIFGRYSGFVWTDTENTPDGTLPVAYADCSTFVSLITKCRPYQKSPYAYAFSNKENINKKQLFNLSLEYGTFDDKPYTFDWLNQIDTTRMPWISYKAGIPFILLSTRTAGNSPVYTNLDQLESGDIVWRANNVAETRYDTTTFKGIDHGGVFVKTLDELSNAAGVPSGVVFKEVSGQVSEIGYIVEFSGSLGSTKYQDCMRISAFEKWAMHETATYNNIVWNNTRIYLSKPISNPLTSNKAQMKERGIISCYDYDCVIRQELDDNGNFVVCNVQPRIPGGLFLQANDDLNDYTMNGVYHTNQGAVISTLKNKPNTNYAFTLICQGFNSVGEYGQQIVLCATSKESVIYMRTKSTGWSAWQRVVMAASDNGNLGVREFDSGTTQTLSVAANSYTDFVVSYDKPFITRAHPLAIISSSSTNPKFGSVSVNLLATSTTGCTFRVLNNSDAQLDVFLHWLAFGE